MNCERLDLADILTMRFDRLIFAAAVAFAAAAAAAAVDAEAAAAEIDAVAADGEVESGARNLFE